VQGRISVSADHFLPVRFVSVPLRSFEVRGDRLTLVKTNVFSEVNPKDDVGPSTQITQAAPDDPLVLSRISCIVDLEKEFVYSHPIRETRARADVKPRDDEIVGANIWKSAGPSKTKMTDGRQYDIDPFVTADGKYIYFSSDRLGPRNIWRIEVSGRGGLVRITNSSSLDTEPAVSPDARNSTVAYTSRYSGATTINPPQIWTVQSDGTLPTLICAGRSPVWSPKGDKIAYVSLDNKIWLMDPDGGNQTQLTTGNSIDCSPVWANEREIIFASNRALNDLRQPNFDLYKMGADGNSPTQLSVNGSFDAAPAITISTDAKKKRFLYFFSNRGAHKAGEESLQIYRTELPAQ
jgi:Tol biopolymer transport system component